ncbi:hypothetical protein BDN72DRAFT_870584 [Pluteus cervinus]|uniref:Uncharacterized protein n=1 Tax=Pluteus cervinus TaxID=181527 RepID=A0ACD3AWG2_9AGAR|nr:hypothetical protein BDN72DRAFT_870584 [Pluteus cervinus]
MTTPSQPVAISPRNPRSRGDIPSGAGTPAQPTQLGQLLDANTNTNTNTPLSSTPVDLRALRAQYTAVVGTPNIPPRSTPIGTSSTPAQGSSPTPQLFDPSSSPAPRIGTGVGLGIVGGISQRRPGTPLGGSGPVSVVGSYASAGPLSSAAIIAGNLATRDSNTAIAGSSTGAGAGAGGSDTPPPGTVEDLPDEEKARVLRRYLVSKEERVAALAKPRTASNAGSELAVSGSASEAPGGLVGQLRRSLAAGGRLDNDGIGSPSAGESRRSSIAASGRQVHVKDDTEPFPIPYHAPGADVTHDIYKWQSDQRKQAARARAASYAGLAPPRAVHPSFEHIHEPGGFRRNYLYMRAGDGDSEVNGGEAVLPPRPVLNNFIEFLYLFGHFAGEDLEDLDDVRSDDEEEDLDEDELVDEHQPSSSRGLVHEQSRGLSTGLSDVLEVTPKAFDEQTPLLGGSSALTTRTERSRSKSRRRRAASVGPRGNATVTQAVLMLLKSFVGTGVLFLAKAFYNGGLLFSSLTFVFIAFISLFSFLLLVETKFIVSGSFGDIGGALYGPWMRYLILGSIVVSQLGFVSAYTIFVAQNLQAFVLGVTDCAKLYSIQYFILLQLIVFLPLVLIRDIAKLSTTALIADAFILVGLVYIFSSEAAILAQNGIAEGVQLWNKRDFPLFIGTAVFSFEGIGLVIPITDAMREPKKFPKVLTGVMVFLCVLFGGAGILGYLTFGKDVQTVVLVNLDSTNRTVQGVQFFYALAILLSMPLQLFPAVRILENGLFTRSGKGDPRVKWMKNSFRFAMVAFCTVLSWVGAADLDKFVAFIGCFACVPLCYVYPPMLHLKAAAKNTRQRVADWLMIVFGMIAFVYTTVQTVKLIMEPDNSPPVFGNCDIPRT